MASDKLIIYQLLPRLFGNTNTTNHAWGTLADNGSGTFADINDAALNSIKTLGATHIWYTGVPEHATMTDYSVHGIKPDDPAVVKGRAGSPYAIKDYYDVVPDFAQSVPDRMAEFEALVARTHAHGLKVIIDLVPNHVARQYRSDAKPTGIADLGEGDDVRQAFSTDNNFYYLPGTTFVAPFVPGIIDAYTPLSNTAVPIHEAPAKVTGSGSINEAPHIDDWYETIKLNYGYNVFDGALHTTSPDSTKRPDTWYKLLDIMLYWAGKGVDGFRCDMAHLVPVAFWQWVTAKVRATYPAHVFIAEIYDPGLYRPFIFEGGFDYLYDKVGLYDALRRLIEGHGSCYDLTRVWQQESGDFAEHMLRFLETHDEQRIASSFFATDPARAIPAMVVTATMHTGPYLVYFGQEVGVRGEDAEGFSGHDGRTTIFDYWGLTDWQGYLNGHNYDGNGLTEQQRELRGFYEKLGTFINGSEAIREGAFYDLQWANQATAGYNQHRVFSYLRYTDSQKLLIVCNFDQTNALSVTLNIPEHALQLMQIAGNDTLLLTDQLLTKETTSGSGMTGIPVTMPPTSVRIFSLNTN
ncbi:alpha-amylase family protein [Fibrella forsythiae]|uniref:Alpha-amylase family protein n=1 Tax=Fibrella forsythiae TaxID=2817061 RepID=A0ABS3JM93_9BACT|nr:alpha-amylase family protein [Fibrella forsythiae]MBO0951129.1 alpha-amylase family protein [Fibrella forsythiae]